MANVAQLDIMVMLCIRIFRCTTCTVGDEGLLIRLHLGKLAGPQLALKSFLSCMMLVMSISLKVVSMAYVF